ncbi:hypothetical protein PWT90_09888 [Aphanocladium album]|nr:hypothetical protein PWT90_09888 [Aphanocladium album]
MSVTEKKSENGHGAALYDDNHSSSGSESAHDVFGSEEHHDIKYKRLSWQLVAVLMIAEIVSNGMLSLPSAFAWVGMVPGIIIIIFLGVFATYTSWLLVKFKLRHPEVHTMADAGYIMFGPIGREIMAFGTFAFAIFATGGQLLAGQIALSTLSDGKLCNLVYTGIFTVASLLLSLPRTFHGLGYVSIISVLSILIAGLVGMAAAAKEPVVGRSVDVVVSSNFYNAFASITNPVFSFAGHFMFFVLISEMKQPKHAMRSAYVLQTFTTIYYVVFAAVTYGYIGSAVMSPSFSSLSPYWAKVSYGIAIPNLLLAAALYAHTAAKVIFVRLFRKSHHLHSHTVLGWSAWVILVVFCNGLSFILATGVPIFNYLVGLAASLFAAWFTYGVAGMFWLHDSYHDEGGFPAWRRKWGQTLLCVFTVLAGAFICVAGLYVTIRQLVDAYASGAIPSPFSCKA